MAFCKYCGTQLEEGTVCSCRQSQTAAEPAPAEAAPQGAPVNIQIDTAKLAGISQSFLSTVIGIFKAPVTGAYEFVKSGTLVTGGLIIFIQSLLTALIFTAISGKINGLIPMGTILSTGKVFFLSLLISLAAAIGYAGLLTLTDKFIFKGNSDFRGMTCVSAVNSLIATPFIAVALILALVLSFGLSFDIGKLLSPILVPSVIAICGGAIGKIAASKALYAATDSSENKQLIAFGVTMLIMLVVTVLMIKGAISSVLSDILKNIGGSISDILEEFMDLGGMGISSLLGNL